ncbi:hypothetical protein ASPWEDRAFT_67750 [Aspergillus wentii DTO 134E9]|uniref:uracil phosphoribosyltransferase n=1 Tax=Aspergillus wentii DTO 134E9 TaxID=1073089 RepID=A0A1L9RRJ1_ASPWE|nr:uncharacterized protein ASPWEDRAFT_67750 [Aspergillus wentii DTO 134E9]KAI9930387.1 hypothetical protein MW887_011140 [Aspergillus wentii]OJJ37545.1 hypothetical protein ASPWEDRAFT_67750 [Aspergillus wentii DTO 134E9]
MSLPSSIRISSHPCLQAKLSLLRSQSTTTRETRTLVTEISTILGVEAFATGLKANKSGTDKTPLGIEYETQGIENDVAIVPILRSGLGMVDAINDLLPTSVPIYHLGLFRERVTLQPVEYYNNLPFQRPSTATSPSAPNTAAASIAVLLDPIIATGATAEAAIHLLREWGVQKVVMISVLGSEGGVRRAVDAWPEGVEMWLGAVDKQCNERGMIVPGLGDIGDRLFVAIGK